MIRLMDDVGAPLAVTAIDLVTEASAPQWNKWAAYGTVALGYLGDYFFKTGPFVKNMGIAAFPWAAKALYEQVRGISSPVSRLAVRPVAAARPGRIATTRPEFAGTRLT